VATQTELLERQEAATVLLEAQNATLHAFLNGASNATVTTESGTIPTLSALIEEIRQRAGYRRWEIHFSVESLLRYETQAEALFRDINTRTVYLDALLAGSYFRLAAPPSGAPLVFILTVGSLSYTITFASGTTTGVVTGPAGVQTIAAGTTFTLKLSSTALNASGFYCALYGMAEAPPA
jgi:hypothetical protein